MPARAAVLATLLLLVVPAAGEAATARELLPPPSAVGEGWRTLLSTTSTPAEAQRFDGDEVPRGLVTSAAFRQFRRVRALPRGGRPEATSEVQLHRDAGAARTRFDVRDEQLATVSTEPVPGLGALGQARRATATRYRREGTTWCAVGALVLQGRALVTVSIGRPVRYGCPPGADLRRLAARAVRRVAAG